jgi:CRP/FNR family transcriptional regulator, cyclic AMP receptor protein
MPASTVFLSTLPEADRIALADQWTVRRFERGEMIIAHDEAGRDVFFVLEGRARATIFSEHGRAVTYRDIEPGDIFGELAAIDGEPRSASVVALEAVRVARLSETAFRKIVTARPTVAWALLQYFSRQMRRMTERLYEFNTLVVRKRLIRELLRIAGSAGGAQGQGSIVPAPTHFELAAKIGTHREAVSREMSALAKRGLIARSGGGLVLHDMETLKALADAREER